jgi:hypothetical protein
VIVDRVTVTETDGGWLRTARVSGRSGELTLEFMVPHVDGASLHTGDAAGFLAATLLPAMLDGEDLHIDAPVSATTLAGCTEVVTAFARWEHRLRPPRITTAGAADPQPPGPGTGCCFSRGADSMVSAVVERPAAATLTHLVHVVGLEPVHSPATLAEEVRLARHVGDLVGLPVVVPQTNVRRLTDGRCDWADAHGVALAALALVADGLFGRVVIPSTQAVDEIVPFGSSPVLEPHLSSESVAVVHDSVSLDRVGKVWMLARDRPDLLPHLKVCWAEDRPDNCGRCGKCLLTMCALQAADALHLATGFPDRIPLEEIRRLRPAPIQSRQHWVAAARALGSDGERGSTRLAILEALHRAARPGPRERALQWWEFLRGRRADPAPSWKDPARGFEWRHHTEMLSLLDRGRPARPVAPAAEEPLVLARARPRVD